MYVEPNSIIKILKGVPLDPTYEHTIYFDNVVDQINYFTTKVEKTVSKATYQRVNKGVARVQIRADELYGCNYMMFQNLWFGTKWFYAFIKRCEYINNETSEIEFEIDDMQTWFFDYTLGMNYVEREHSSTDNIYDYNLPEPVDIGDYITGYDSRNSYISFMALDTIVATGYNPDPGTVVLKGMNSNIYNGIYYTPFQTWVGGDDPNGTACSAYIEQIIEDQGVDSILAVFTCPHAITQFYIHNMAIGVRTSHMENVINYPYDRAFTSFKTGTREYTPKNRKLYAFPYNFLYLYDNIGENYSILKPQYLETSTGYINFDGSVGLTTEPSFTVYPSRYKGREDSVEDGITFDNYPQCAFNIDVVKAYIASGGAMRDVLTIGGNFLGTVNASVQQNPLGIAQTSVGVAQGINNLVHNMNKPDTARVGSATGGLICDYKYLPVVERRHIDVNHAIAIDNFFSKYGYACEQVKIPNRNVRPHWCYTKTAKCVLEGNNIPADAEQHICEIYDHGITFWKNGDEVGNYSLDNSVGL